MSVKVFVKLQIEGENGAEVDVVVIDGRVGGTCGVDVEGFGVVMIPLDVEVVGFVDDSEAVEGFVVKIELVDDIVEFTDMFVV